MWPFSPSHGPEGTPTPQQPQQSSGEATPEGDKAKFLRLQSELKPLYQQAKLMDDMPTDLLAQMTAYALETTPFSDVDAHCDIAGLERVLAEAKKLFPETAETVH